MPIGCMPARNSRRGSTGGGGSAGGSVGGGFGSKVSKTFCQLVAPFVVRYSLNLVRWKNVNPAGSALAAGVASDVRKCDSAGLLNSGMPVQPTSHFACVLAGLRRLRMMNE